MKRFLKHILQILFSRLFIFATAILIQLFAIVLVAIYLSNYNVTFYIIYTIASIITILYIVSSEDNPAYKLAWAIPIALFPLLGWMLYLLFGRSKVPKRKTAALIHAHEPMSNLAPQDPLVTEELRQKDIVAYRQFSYLRNVTDFPVSKTTLTTYLSPGESFFARLCKELEKAERFILMEYFILEEGVMWDTILEILIRKAQAGVEVKFLFDDLGCLTTLPFGYEKKLRSYGIETHVFNPFRPSLDAFMNFRDHRKITVIDGNVGFTGGNNLADEYINAYEKHGYWKDSSIMLKGDAVWSLTLLFMEIWSFYDHKQMEHDRYRPTKQYESDGFIACYGDSPLDDERVGEMCYMNMIQNAQNTVTITTPYLILDYEMKVTLCTAAKRGVRVQIITPDIADKWFVHAVTRYNYRSLIEAGVEIYEYTGSFLHAKTLVADDRFAIVGTQNFDFRSFFLHFECGVMLYDSSTIPDISADHASIIAKSHRVTLEESRSKNPFWRLVQVCLNLFAPLM